VIFFFFYRIFEEEVIFQRKVSLGEFFSFAWGREEGKIIPGHEGSTLC